MLLIFDTKIIKITKHATENEILIFGLIKMVILKLTLEYPFDIIGSQRLRECFSSYQNKKVGWEQCPNLLIQVSSYFGRQVFLYTFL